MNLLIQLAGWPSVCLATRQSIKTTLFNIDQGRQPQFFQIRRRPTIFQIKRGPHTFKIRKPLRIFKLEDDVTFLNWKKTLYNPINFFE